MKPTLTPLLIAAASLHAGNRSMRAGGRTVWNEDDYNAACAENNRLHDVLASHHIAMQSRTSLSDKT